jgi:hypothetical protein
MGGEDVVSGGVGEAVVPNVPVVVLVALEVAFDAGVGDLPPPLEVGAGVGLGVAGMGVVIGMAVVTGLDVVVTTALGVVVLFLVRLVELEVAFDALVGAGKVIGAGVGAAPFVMFGLVLPLPGEELLKASSKQVHAAENPPEMDALELRLPVVKVITKVPVPDVKLAVLFT